MDLVHLAALTEVVLRLPPLEMEMTMKVETVDFLASLIKTNPSQPEQGG